MPRRAKIVLVVAVLLAGLLVAWQFRKSPGEKSTAQSPAPTETAQQHGWDSQKSAPPLDLFAAPAPSHTETQTTDVDSPAVTGRLRLPAPHDGSAAAAASTAAPSSQTEKPADTLPDHTAPDHTATLPASKPAEAAVPELPANFSGTDHRDAKSPFDLQADSGSEQPAERTHKIVDGDSLASLAERYLGSANRAGEIFACNRDVLSDPELLPIGVRLRIPSGTAHPADKIAPPSGLTADATPSAAAPSTAVASNPVSPSQSSTETAKSAPLLEINSPGLLPLPPLGEHAHSPGRIYIVQAGDTLADIARKLCGDSRHIDALLQANREQLRSEQDLRPGMMLEAP